MALLQNLATLAVSPLLGKACEALGLPRGEGAVGSVAQFLSRRFSEHDQRLTEALRWANDSAWKALEIAVAGDSFWERCRGLLASGAEKAFRDQVRALFAVTPLAAADATAFRQKCLSELRAARKAGLLTGGQLEAEGLARQAGTFARFAEPQKQLAAEEGVCRQMGAHLRQAGHAHLASLVELRPPQADPLLVVAVRYFFREAVEQDAELARVLAFAQMEGLQQGQQEGFEALGQALRTHGQRVEELLQDLGSAVADVNANVLDLKAMMQLMPSHDAIRQIVQEVMQAQAKHRMERPEVRPGDSLSIGNDAERRLVKQLVTRYRALPEQRRRELPGLLNAIGQLEVATGDFLTARQDFATVATLVDDAGAKGEAHHNAYRAALEQRDWDAAFRELIEAVKLDGKRFAPFPVGKYHPLRILGAGGFGVAFLCRHKQLNAEVVVKTLAGDELDRNVDEVFAEARALYQLDHPSIIRLQDCGYTLPASKSRPYLVMNYFKGTTLEDCTRQQPLPVNDLVAVARAMAEGLRAAHGQNILHRDVKPANVLVCQEGGRWQVKLIDFGLALRRTSLDTVAAAHTLQGSSIAGTVDYAAPEQMGKAPGVLVGPHSDIYGFARTCCYALFQTPHPRRQHWQQIPAPLAELLDQCLDDSPQRRPADFAAVLDRLGQLGNLAPLAVRVPDAVPQTAKQPPPPAVPVSPPPAPVVPAGSFGVDADLADNPEPRCPCLLLLDVSRSMAGERIAQLNEGLKAYQTDLLADDLAMQRVEVAIVTFGTRVSVACPFTTAEHFRPPMLSAGGKTPMGAAINLGLDLLAQRKQRYRAHGNANFRPWVFLITDGGPTDDWRTAAERVKQGEAARAFSFFTVGVEGAKFEVLRQLCTAQPFQLKGLQFRDLFLWLSQSQRSVSQSSPGQEDSMPSRSPRSWASLGGGG